MGSNKEYLFVNANNNPPMGTKRKGLPSVKAFLMRNIRANQEWPKRKTTRTTDRVSLDHEIRPHSPTTEQSLNPICYGEHISNDSEVQIVPEDPITCPTPGEQFSALGSQIQWYCGILHGTVQPRICAKCWQNDDLPISSIRPSPLDPFDSLAIPLDATVSNLLTYFIEAVSPGMTPITGKILATQVHQCWIQPSFSHSGFMHALLSLTALQLAAAQPHQIEYYSSLTLYHRARAIAAIQHNLTDMSLAISDENIAAVFNILCVEENMFLPVFTTARHINPDANQLHAHIHGLNEMIRLRGGILELGSFKPLQHFIIRHTEPQAAISFEGVNILPPDLIGQLFQEYPKGSRFYGEPGPMWRQSNRIGVDSGLLELIRTMECLLQDTRAWFEAPNTSQFDALDLNTLHSAIISMCVRWYLTTEREGRLKPVDAILGLCLLQFTAFLCRSTCPAYSGPISVLELLKQHLFCRYDENMAILNATNLDVWVGLLAVLSSDGIRGYHDVFWDVYVDIFVKKSNDFRDFEDLQTFLTTHCLWSPFPMDIHAKNIWDETPDWIKQNTCTGSLDPADMERRSQRTTRLAAILVSPNPYLHVGGHPMGHIQLDSETLD
ncbi:hypothetical protein V8C35DRAFT_22652 [Trichoderma chlorosporum]